MDKITVTMSPSEYERFLAYKEADRIAKNIRPGIGEMKKNSRQLRKMPTEYLFSTKDFKFNRDEVNDYE